MIARRNLLQGKNASVIDAQMATKRPVEPGMPMLEVGGMGHEVVLKPVGEKAGVRAFCVRSTSISLTSGMVQGATIARRRHFWSASWGC